MLLSVAYLVPCRVLCVVTVRRHWGQALPVDARDDRGVASGRPPTADAIKQSVFQGGLVRLGPPERSVNGWPILSDAGMDPAPRQFTTTTPTRIYVRCVIEVRSRYVRILGTTAHPGGPRRLVRDRAGQFNASSARRFGEGLQCPVRR